MAMYWPLSTWVNTVSAVWSFCWVEDKSSSCVFLGKCGSRAKDIGRCSLIFEVVLPSLRLTVACNESKSTELARVLIWDSAFALLLDITGTSTMSSSIQSVWNCWRGWADCNQRLAWSPCQWRAANERLSLAHMLNNTKPPPSCIWKV